MTRPAWGQLTHLAQQVTCPECRASPGTPCTTRAAMPAHPARIRKATKETRNA